MVRFSDINNIRYSLGICMFVNGEPIVFFFRDTLHIGPANSTFTALFLAAGLVLMLPEKLLLRLYKPNYKLLTYATLFWGIVLIHFLVYNNSNADGLKEIGNFVYTFAFIFLLIHTPNSVRSTFIEILFIVSLFSNFTLIYSLLIDQNWNLGMRAAVTFANPYAQEGGDPHTTARNSLICMLAGLVLINKYKNITIKLLIFINILISLALIVLAQVKSAVLAVVLIILAIIYTNTKLRVIYKIFSYKNFIIFLLISIIIYFFIQNYYLTYSIVYGYWVGLGNRLINISYTVFGFKFSETAIIDDSAMWRVRSITYFLQVLSSFKLILFGEGYKSQFMDVPILESLVNHGMLGFIFYFMLNYYLFKYAFRELRSPNNSLTIFLAYFFIYFIVQLVTNGRPYDVSFWFPYSVMIRFLGIKYIS